MRTALVTLAVCLCALPVHAKYSGGTGEPNDAYQIATAEDLMLLGETPDDYDKNFILTSDIDLDPNLPGRRVFDKAVIAPDADPSDEYSQFQGTPFTGTFDGDGHTILNLTIRGRGYLGVFGHLLGSWDAPVGVVKSLGVVDVNIVGSGAYVGGLAGDDAGWVTSCYSTGDVRGVDCVGGLVGIVSGREVIDAYYYGTVTNCHSSASVSGTGDNVGGLVGYNEGTVTRCYSTGVVDGNDCVGGLVGDNEWGGVVTRCYSTGAVSGNMNVGGLVGTGSKGILHSVWDMEASRQSGSAGAVGLNTPEMMDPYMLGLNGFADDPNWVLDAGRDYPRLAWEGTPGGIVSAPVIDWLEGQGTPDRPYQVDTAEQLIRLARASVLWDKHFVLGADIDLDPRLPGRRIFAQAPIAVFMGVFDGQGHAISNVVVEGGSYVGLFGEMYAGAELRHLGVVDGNIVGAGYYVGGLVGYNEGTVTRCYNTCMVSGTGRSVDPDTYWAATGGLVGENNYGGTVTKCYSTGAVHGSSSVGGLVGLNNGTMTYCYATGEVAGASHVGGLVGLNSAYGTVAYCYARALVRGSGPRVGGLMGHRYNGNVTQCYSTGVVNGGSSVGGLVGESYPYPTATTCFWDTETSGQATSAGGTGKTTAEMRDPNTFTPAGWDFVGRPDGPHDIWAEPEGGGYPVLWWQLSPLPELPFSGGTGEPNDPYRIATPAQLNAIGHNPRLMTAHFELVSDIDLAGIDFYHFYAIGTERCPFAGSFCGNGHRVSHPTVLLFDYIGSGAEVRDLGVVEINFSFGGDMYVGGLARHNLGTVSCCYTTGAITGHGWVGGLVGANEGTVSDCYSTCSVNGSYGVGGLVGCDWYGFGTGGMVTHCYSAGVVSCKREVDELDPCRYVYPRNNFWDAQISGPGCCCSGIAKTTAEMQTAKTFLDAGWDFVDETANGTEDIWWILEGKDYPRLWWEGGDGASK